MINERDRRQMQLESLVEYISDEETSSVGLENAFKELKTMGSLNVIESRKILDVACENASLWAEKVGAESIVVTLTHPFRIYKKFLEENEEPVKAKKESLGISSEILSRIIETDKDGYDGDSTLASCIKNGIWGEPSEVLKETITKLLKRYNAGEIWESNRPDEVCYDFVSMMDDLRIMKKESLVEIKDQIPFGLMFLHDEVFETYPEVYNFIKDVSLGENEKVSTLVNGFAIAEDGDEAYLLKKRIHQGEFGDPLQILTRTVSFLCSEESALHVNEDIRDMIASDLWIEILDMDEKNRTSKMLKPLREKISRQQWYWQADEEDIVYTALDTFNALELEKDDIESFVRGRANQILDALLANNKDSADDSVYKTRKGINDALDRIARNKDMVAKKLGIILKGVKAYKKSDMELDLPDSLLIACLDPMFS